MRTTNDLYKTLLADPAHVKENRLTIGGVIYDESQIVSLSTSELLFAEDTMSIGGAVAREIDFAAFLDDSVPKRAQIIHEVRLKLEDEVSEWLQKGVYYIDTRSKDPLTGVTTVHGFDAMLMAEQEWIPPAEDEFPMDMKTAVELTAATLGLTIDPRTTFKTGDAYKVDYPVASADESEEQQALGLSIRQMWRWVAAAHGGNFIINDLGQLRLVPLNALPGNTGYLVTESGRPISFGGVRILIGQSDSGSSVVSDDKVYVGNQVADVAHIPAFPPISQIVLKVSDGAAFVSKSDTEGMTLEASCAYATQKTADNLLTQLKGYAYQPVQAEDALIDPAAELGDGLTLNGVYTVLAQKDTLWDMLAAANIGAPGSAELENEYIFTPAPEAEYRYELAKTLSLIAKTNEKIDIGIYGPEGSFTKLNLSLDNLSAEVHGADGAGGLTGAVAKLKLSLDGLSSEVHGADGTGGLAGKYSAIDQKVSNIKLSVTNENGEVSISLNSGEEGMGSGTIDLTGMVTFSALNNAPGTGVTKINGGWIDADTLNVKAANISGQLNVDKINMKGNISWDFLDATTQKTIEDAAKSGGHTDRQIRTLINDRLVSSPTIAGGVFQDEPDYPDAALYLDKETDRKGNVINAGVVLERNLYREKSNGDLKLDETLQTLNIWDDGFERVSFLSREQMFLSLVGGIEAYAYGLWVFGDTVRFKGKVDFSDADVTGL